MKVENYPILVLYQDFQQNLQDAAHDREDHLESAAVPMFPNAVILLFTRLTFMVTIMSKVIVNHIFIEIIYLVLFLHNDNLQLKCTPLVVGMSIDSDMYRSRKLF